MDEVVGRRSGLAQQTMCVILADKGAIEPLCHSRPPPGPLEGPPAFVADEDRDPGGPGDVACAGAFGGTAAAPPEGPTAPEVSLALTMQLRRLRAEAEQLVGLEADRRRALAEAEAARAAAEAEGRRLAAVKRRATRLLSAVLARAVGARGA